MIDGMNIGSGHKLALIAVLEGVTPAAVIDIYAGREAPCVVMSLLKKLELHFCQLSTSGENKNHLCSLAVSKNEIVTNSLRAAITTNNKETKERLLRMPCTFPLQMPYAGTPLFDFFDGIKTYAKHLYDEMLTTKQLILQA